MISVLSKPLINLWQLRSTNGRLQKHMNLMENGFNFITSRRSGDRIPVGARLSAPVQTDPGAPLTLLCNDYLVLSGDEAAGQWR